MVNYFCNVPWAFEKEMLSPLQEENYRDNCKNGLVSLLVRPSVPLLCLDHLNILNRLKKLFKVFDKLCLLFPVGFTV